MYGVIKRHFDPEIANEDSHNKQQVVSLAIGNIRISERCALGTLHKVAPRKHNVLVKFQYLPS